MTQLELFDETVASLRQFIIDNPDAVVMGEMSTPYSGLEIPGEWGNILIPGNRHYMLSIKEQKTPAQLIERYEAARN